MNTEQQRPQMGVRPIQNGVQPQMTPQQPGVPGVRPVNVVGSGGKCIYLLHETNL
jgi:hypothetical protein